jgi:hypothetical protein
MDDSARISVNTRLPSKIALDYLPIVFTTSREMSIIVEARGRRGEACANHRCS